jgi:hypothetical protein
MRAGDRLIHQIVVFSRTLRRSWQACLAVSEFFAQLQAFVRACNNQY